MALELGAGFAAAGHELALVGGPVRDALLGRLGDDLDLTTDARPEDVLRLVDGWADAVWDVGIAFGTVGVRKGGQKLEITTYRSEAYDRSSRKPEVGYGDSLEDDLRAPRLHRERDGRVGCRASSFVDPHGGLDDLARRRAPHARARPRTPSTTTRCG